MVTPEDVNVTADHPAIIDPRLGSGIGRQMWSDRKVSPQARSRPMLGELGTACPHELSDREQALRITVADAPRRDKPLATAMMDGLAELSRRQTRRRGSHSAYLCGGLPLVTTGGKCAHHAWRGHSHRDLSSRP